MNQRLAFALGVLFTTVLCVVIVTKTPWEVHAVGANDSGSVGDAASEFDAALVEAGLDAGLNGDAWEDDSSASSLDAQSLMPAASGPRSVRAGVILVAYAGAEGAGSTARTRDAARSLAESLATTAKVDFKEAVAKGDSGSFEDIGRIPRGVLERAVESTLFSLAVGEVSTVVDTPRGYWIAKRLE